MSLKLQKALLVDDDCLTNYLNQMILQESGIFEEVEIAETAVEALDKLSYEESNHYMRTEIIFLDLSLPGLNGWDFVREFNDHSKSNDKKTKIVILTSSDNPDDKIKAVYAKGVYAYINKPLTANKLTDLVAKYLH